MNTSRFTYFLYLIVLSITIYGQSSFHGNVNDKCEYCHINESNTSESYVPSWQKTDFHGFTPYSSSTLNAEVGVPIGSSKLCLGCHDGVISGGHSNFRFTDNKQIIGSDLNKNHPVSFDYSSFLALSDRSLKDPKSALSGLGGTIESDLLVNGKLECVSCHDIHGMKKNKNLLIISNYRSQLCLTCHNK